MMSTATNIVVNIASLSCEPCCGIHHSFHLQWCRCPIANLLLSYSLSYLIFLSYPPMIHCQDIVPHLIRVHDLSIHSPIVVLENEWGRFALGTFCVAERAELSQCLFLLSLFPIDVNVVSFLTIAMSWLSCDDALFQTVQPSFDQLNSLGPSHRQQTAICFAGLQLSLLANSLACIASGTFDADAGHRFSFRYATVGL